jgi:DNA-binding NtrC family response regulator
MVSHAGETMNVLTQRRVHTAIVDMDSKIFGGLGMLKTIKNSFPLLPCILLADTAEEKLLSAALELDVFSVMNKPVDIQLLQKQLHKLFVKKYNSNLFYS